MAGLDPVGVLVRASRHPYWLVAFSGGKDSTVLLDLVVGFLLEGCPGSPGGCPRVLVVYGDTLLEPPPLRRYARGVVGALNRLASREGLPLRAVAAEPAPGEDLAGMVARGYTAPSPRFRWCTKRWKLLPARRALEAWLGRRPRPGELAVLTGVRAEESTLRASRARRGPRGCPAGSCFKAPWGTGYAPILPWGAREVWGYLESHTPAWGSPSWGILEEIYAATGSRGSLRMGCWACTLIRRERAWHALEEAGLTPRGSTRILRGWVDTWLWLSRGIPWKARLPGPHGYGKLKPEARWILLESLYLHAKDPRTAEILEPLKPRILKALETLETLKTRTLNSGATSIEDDTTD